jgi:hypothetical protein
VRYSSTAVPPAVLKPAGVFQMRDLRGSSVVGSQTCRRADARTVSTCALSPGNAHDAPEGRALLQALGPMPEGLPLLMNSAYDGNETRRPVLDLGMISVVPPNHAASSVGL